MQVDRLSGGARLEDQAPRSDIASTLSGDLASGAGLEPLADQGGALASDGALDDLHGHCGTKRVDIAGVLGRLVLYITNGGLVVERSLWARQRARLRDFRAVRASMSLGKPQVVSSASALSITGDL